MGHWQLELTLQSGTKLALSANAWRPTNSPGTIELKFQWPDAEVPTTAAKLVSNVVGEPPESLCECSDLFPADDAAFERTFINQARRPADRGTQYFIADQISRWFSGFAGYRCAATVVAVYKATESMRSEELSRAVEMVSSSLEALKRLPKHRHPRRNPEHLRLSLLTALWHAQLAANEPTQALATMEKVLEVSGDMKSYATTAYPACRCLVLLGWVAWRLGRPLQARAAWWRVTELYALAVNDIDLGQGVIYGELRDVLKSADLAVKGVHLIDGTLPTSLRADLSTTAVLDRALRVSGDAKARIAGHLMAWLEGPTEAAR